MFYTTMQINKDYSKGSPYIKAKNQKVFSSQDGKIARTLNKTAPYRAPINTINGKPLEGFYPDATADDLKLLLSGRQRDILKKCSYVNPEDLRTYNILLKSKNKDGTLNIRILDDYGKFIKEAQIKPKKVIVLDNFLRANVPLTFDNQQQIPHGEVVKKIIQRSNPFNDYEFIDVNAGEGKLNPSNAMEQLLQRVEAGEKIDAISCSFAQELSEEALEKLFNIKLKNKPMVEQKEILQAAANSHPGFREFQNIYKTIEQLHNHGVKIFIGAGNANKIVNGKIENAINLDLFAKGPQGVGALDNENKIAGYSASRKSIFTPHYENGDLLIEYRPGGFNIAGGAGIDVPYSKQVKDLYKEIQKLDVNSTDIEEKDNQKFYKGIPVKINYGCYVYPSAIARGGTSWATPRRVAEYTKYLMLKDII